MVRSWTLIVSVVLHVLAALVLARMPMALGHEATTRDVTLDTVVPLEVAMLDQAPHSPVNAHKTVPEPAMPLPPSDPTPAQAPAPPTARPSLRPEVPRPEPEVASLEPKAGTVAPRPDASRSLSMRPHQQDEDGPTLDLSMPPVGDAAHAFGLSIGAPIVNMEGPERPLPQTGEGTLGHTVGGGRYEKKKLQFGARTDPDGKVHFSDSEAYQGEYFADPETGNVGLRVTFDITDQLMRAHGMDPYWAAKLRWLDETRDERDAMALAARRERLRAAIARLPVFLDAVWRDDRYSASDRRRILFQLWDECAEDGPEDIVLAAQEVRLTIEAFVRKRLPAGTPDAFAAPELDSLNSSRTSRSTFHPY